MKCVTTAAIHSASRIAATKSHPYMTKSSEPPSVQGPIRG
jgi:hypothetical protein